MAQKCHSYFITLKLAALTCILFLNLKSVNCKPKPTDVFTSDKLDSNNLQLIKEASSWFPQDWPLTGYEVFLRRYNDSVESTVFISEHIPDHQVFHNASDDFEEKLIILPGQIDTLKVPYKNVTTYLVLRQIPAKPDRYTSHLAYIRNFNGEVSVEWDLYSFHFHNSNGSFLSAFFPNRDGPEQINLGMGHIQTRSKRGDSDDPNCSRGNFYLGKCNELTRNTRATSQFNYQNAPNNNRQGPPNSGNFNVQGPPRPFGGTNNNNNFQGARNIGPPIPINSNPNWQGQPNTNKNWQNPPKGFNQGPVPVPQGTGNSNSNWQAPPTQSLSIIPTVPPLIINPKISKYYMPQPINTNIPPNPSQIPSPLAPTSSETKDPTKLHWSYKTTEPTPLEIDDKSKGEDYLDHTEFPMYGDVGAGNGLDDFGFTTLPPWSEFRKAETTELSIPFSNDISSNFENNNGKPCFDFGLERNCGNQNKPAKKFAFKKGCAFGFRCKDASFLERYAVITTTTTQIPQIKHESDKKPEKKPKKTEEECKAEKAAENSPKGNFKKNLEDECEEYRKHEIPIEEEDNSDAVNLSSLIPGGSSVSPSAPLSPNSNGTEHDPEKAAKIAAANPFANSLKDVEITGQITVTTTDPSWFQEGDMQMYIPPGDEGGAESTPPKGYGGTGYDHDGAMEDEMKGESDTDTPANRKRRRKRSLRSPNSNKKRNVNSNGASGNKAELFENKASLEKLEQPFVGVGDCPFTYPKRPQSQNEVLHFFMGILRVDCHPDFQKNTETLFQSKLSFDDQLFRISLNTNQPSLTKKTMGEQEWLEYSSAIFLHAFSNVYANQYEKYMAHNFAENKSPDEKRLSGTIKTLTLFSLKILELMKSAEKIHAVKLANALIVALQGQRSELVTSQDDLEKCGKCDIGKEYNFNDQVQLNILMRFIVDKLGEVIVTGESSESIFNKFYRENLQVNVQHVKNKSPFVF